MQNQEKDLARVLHSPRIAEIVKDVRIALASGGGANSSGANGSVAGAAAFWGPWADMFCKRALPASILICVRTAMLCKQHGFDGVVWLSRDGYWQDKVFRTLFPEIQGTYFYWSRLGVNSPLTRDAIVKGLANVPGTKKLCVDLFGSGTTYKKMLGNAARLRVDVGTSLMMPVNDSELFHFRNGHVDYTMHMLGSKRGKAEGVATTSEDLLMAPHGSLGDDGELKEPEYDVSLLRPYIAGIARFSDLCKCRATMGPLLPPLASLDAAAIDDLFGDWMISLDRSWFTQYLTHIHVHQAVAPQVAPLAPVGQPKAFPLQYGPLVTKVFVQRVIKFDINGFFLCTSEAAETVVFLEAQLNWKGNCGTAERLVDFLNYEARPRVVNLLCVSRLDQLQRLLTVRNVEYEHIIVVGAEDAEPVLSKLEPQLAYEPAAIGIWKKMTAEN